MTVQPNMSCTDSNASHWFLYLYFVSALDIFPLLSFHTHTKQRCEYIAGAKPSDWPTFELRRGGAVKDEGLKVGVTVTIVLVTLIVGLMMAFLVVRSIRRRRSGKEELDGSFPTFRKAGQNAPKDPSEALNIEMDGSGFRETIFSSVTKGSGNYSFEVDSEMGTPKQAETISYNDDMPPPPPPPASPPHENGRQHGMVGGSARPSWGGQML